MQNEPRADAPTALCSVVIPAYNEASVIQDRLGGLLASFQEGEIEAVVVANGCTDGTAETARRLPLVQVLDLREPSKTAALNAGDAVVSAYPRVYMDADVRLTGDALRRMVDTLRTDRPLVAAPRMTFDLSGSSWVVRTFHAVFERLPYTHDHVVGGVHGVSEAGRRRFGSFPDVVADDLFVQCLFAPEERVTVDATFEVVAPKTAQGLLAVRTRVARGNREIASRAADLGLGDPSSTSSTSSTARALLRLVLRRPYLLPAAAVYTAVTALARARGRTAAANAIWERDESSRGADPENLADADRVVIDGVAIDPVTEHEVVQEVLHSVAAGRGGWIMTPNVDIHRQLRQPENMALVGAADVVVADGMPIIWASRLQRQPLPERVTGASLVWALARAAAEEGRSVFLLGAQPAVAATAVTRMEAEIAGLVVAGRYSPAWGFESSPQEQERIADALTTASPDIVFVGLGFPKQERLTLQLRTLLPSAWFIGCGGSIDFIAGHTTRAPQLLQRVGLEWVFRLGQEPRRLFKRYVVHGIPHAVRMLTLAALAGVRGPRAGR